MGVASPVESRYRFDSCFYAKCVVEMCSAWEGRRAEEDLGVPGKGNPGSHRQPLQEMILKIDLSIAVKKPIGDL